MSIIRSLTVALSGVLLAGCAASSLQSRVETLETERQDLIRRNTELLSDLSACRSRCDALQRELDSRSPRSGVTGGQFDLPEDMRAKGIQIKKNGHGETVIDIPSDVFFASGSAVLNRHTERTMVEIVEFIRASAPGGTLRVEGHSDTDPIVRTKNKYHCNWELSFERAHAVLHYLVEKGGIDPRRLAIDCYGEHQPIDPRNKAKNRRVEIVLSK